MCVVLIDIGQTSGHKRGHRTLVVLLRLQLPPHIHPLPHTNLHTHTPAHLHVLRTSSYSRTPTSTLLGYDDEGDRIYIPCAELQPGDGVFHHDKYPGGVNHVWMFREWVVPGKPGPMRLFQMGGGGGAVNMESQTTETKDCQVTKKGPCGICFKYAHIATATGHCTFWLRTVARAPPADEVPLSLRSLLRVVFSPSDSDDEKSASPSLWSPLSPLSSI